LERRLAAILAADVVGYSRLMGEDEAGTLERLKANRWEVIDPLIGEHAGRIVKLMGDGALMEFASVVQAVAFAIEMQRRMAERNEGARANSASTTVSASTSATFLSRTKTFSVTASTLPRG
jgi:adenylate cyclase